MQSVTVVIPAYNEAENIRSLLTDLIAQKTTAFNLQKIHVISDGSTDETVQEIMKVQHPTIEFMHFPERKGKASRLNNFFKNCKSDIIIKIDADVRIKDTSTLEELVKAFKTNPTIGIVAGNYIPFQPQYFVEQVAHFGYHTLEDAKNQIGTRAIKYRCDGHMQAISQAVARHLVIPSNVATDVYTYYYARSLGYEAVHVTTAKVFYRLPSKITEYLLQSRRYLKSNVYHYFPEKLIRESETLSFYDKASAVLRKFTQAPIVASTFIITVIISHVMALFYVRGPQWEIARTTKHDLTYEK
jgi:glycosyltransferase involved in cell wall biosynthesis